MADDDWAKAVDAQEGKTLTQQVRFRPKVVMADTYQLSPDSTVTVYCIIHDAIVVLFITVRCQPCRLSNILSNI